ncbi:MAG: hypothetical protein J6Z08_02210 [Elusimicrobiales bacterium]|jgi:hypothetical protein|nr:hypothetical protein [Elusimicrobiales bacterium]
MATRRTRKRFSAVKFIRTNFTFTVIIISVLLTGSALIARQMNEVRRAKKTYEQQRENLKNWAEQERELEIDRFNIDNPALFEEIARKNGYKFENETVVNVTKPISEADKWK